MANTYFTPANANDRLAQLWMDLRLEAVSPQPSAKQPETIVAVVPPGPDEASRRRGRANLSTLFQDLLEPEVARVTLRPASEAIPPGEVFSGPSMQAADETASASSSPFRWEPKPAWITGTSNATPAFLYPADVRRFAAIPKIPRHPLHKLPFYRRIFFYLSRWLKRPR